MHSLYHICILRLAKLADQDLDLSSIPFDPFLDDLLRAVFQTRNIGLIQGALESIGQSHGKHLGDKTHRHLASVCLDPGYRWYNQATLLKTIETRFPHGICNLNLSHSNTITDDHMFSLKQCTNLQVLDLSYTAITDAGIATLARITKLNESHLGLKCLKLLGVAGNRLSDRVLKHLAGIRSLQGMDLSYTTAINADIATSYLARSGYAVLPKRIHQLIGWDDNSGCQCKIPIHNSELTRLMQMTLYPARAPDLKTRRESNIGTSHLCLFRQHDQCKRNAPEMTTKHSATDLPARKKQRREQSLENYLLVIEQEIGLS
ncbi:hypothetical protein K492DRAFT_172202 [Lichtheimia hyalospora FSU 10163]|nr:hypothetical protein K492DRAFT_172202 [Lichtheimia hyalospora FSU 10163]